MVAQRRLAGVLRRVVVVQAEKLLARVRQQSAEDLRGGQFGVELRRLAGHPQGVVVAANLHALAAALAEVADENGEDAAVAGALFLDAAEDGGDVVVGQRQLIDDLGELAARLLGNRGELIHLGAEDVLERLLALVVGVVDHAGAATILEALDLVEQIFLLLLVGDVVADGGDEDGAEVLRGVGQGGVGAGGDALHALGAVLGNVNRRLAAGDVFALRRADARAHQAHAGQRAGRLMVAKVIAVLGVKLGHGLERRALLSLRHGAAWAAGAFAAGGGNHLNPASVIRREQRVAHGRCVGVLDLADIDFLHALEAADHHFHVRLDNSLAEAAELFLVLLVHDVVVLLLADVMILEEGGHLEECAEERVALHAQLQILSAGGVAGDIETGQDKNPDVVVPDELPVLGRDAFPCLLGRVARFPYEATALVDALERVRVRERLGVAAQHHVHVVQLAVHLDALRRHGQVIVCRRALFLRAIFRIGHDEELVLQLAKVVIGRGALGNNLAKVADDLAKVFAGGDHAPAADRVEPHRDRAAWQ